MLSIHSDHTDHVHNALIDEDGTVCPIVNFDYGALDPAIETLVPMAQMSSALMRILDWLTASRDFRFSGAKVHMLKVLLDPVNGEFRNMSQIARECRISRAVLSKAFTDLREAYGIRLIAGKLDSSRATYRQTQRNLVAAGRHASQQVKAKAAIRPNKNESSATASRYCA